MGGRSPRRRLRRAALAAAGIAVALVAAELGVRRFLPQPAFFSHPGLYVADPAIGYRMRPGVDAVVGNWAEFESPVHVNRAGTRGPEIAPRRPGVLRILVLGDSLTFGPGVGDEQAFPLALAGELGKRGVAAEGINAGIGGYGPPQEVAWFGRYGRALAPDVVVLGIFTGNDLQDASPDRKPLAVVDGELQDEADRRRSAVFHWLFQSSQLVALAKYSLPVPLDRGLRRLLHLPEPGAARALREEMKLYQRAPLAETLAGATASEAAIARLVELARPARVAALLLPSYLQADDRAWTAALADLELAAGDYDRLAPNRLFEEALARHAVPTLDLTPVFADAMRRGEIVFYPHDHHYTLAGHREIARHAADFLEPPR